MENEKVNQNLLPNLEKSSKGRHIEELEELILFKKYLKTVDKRIYNKFVKLKINENIDLLESTFNMYSKLRQARHIDDE